MDIVAKRKDCSLCHNDFNSRLLQRHQIVFASVKGFTDYHIIHLFADKTDFSKHTGIWFEYKNNLIQKIN